MDCAGAIYGWNGGLLQVVLLIRFTKLFSFYKSSGVCRCTTSQDGAGPERGGRS